MRPVVPRLAAERDVEDAAAYYARTAGEDVALRFASAVQHAYRAIGVHPRTGSPRLGQETGLAGVRTRRLVRFPYLVCYVEGEDHIDVWRVLHARRDVPAELGKAPG